MWCRLCTVGRPFLRAQHRCLSNARGSPQLPPQPPHAKEVLEALRYYDQHYTYRGWRLLRIAGIVGVTTVAAATYFHDPIIRYLSGRSSEVARQTMQDRKVQLEVDRITRQTTNTLLNDPQTVEVTVEFLLQLLQKEETRVQAVAFLSAVVTDPKSIRALTEMLRDPETVRQLQTSANILLQNPEIRRSLNQMVLHILEDPDTVEQLEIFLLNLLGRESVKRGVSDFVSDVLRYREVVDAANVSSKEIIEDLSNDEEVHSNLAVMGYSSIKRMVFPSFFFRQRAVEPSKVEEERKS